MESMKAAVLTAFGGAEKFEIQTVPTPTLKANQVLVRVCATSINPVDYQTRRGDYKELIRLPAILGVDVSGVIEAIGEAVTDFKVGDNVYYSPQIFGEFGSYAQYHVADAAIVALKPANLSHIEAASFPLAGGTAWDCLVTRGNLQVGETVLIHAGAGGVGSIAVQLAKAIGAYVFATCSSRNRDFVTELGADRVIDYKNEDYVEVIRQETNGLGVDLVLDTIGGETIGRSLEIIRPFGRLTSIVDIAIPQSLLEAWSKNLTIHFVFSPQYRAKLEALTKLIERHQLRPVIDSVLSWDRVVLAHQRLEQGGTRIGNKLRLPNICQESDLHGVKLITDRELRDEAMSRNNRDHAKKMHRPMVEDEAIASQLEALLTPAITAQENYYRQLGLRDRILNLPFMVAAVLTLLWRDVAGVTELTRMLAREGFLWCKPQNISQQAISQRFLTFPACLFEKVFKDLLPYLQDAWQRRSQRKIPESIQFTLFRFEKIWIVDCSILEALFQKLESLKVAPTGQLAGKIGTVVDLVNLLPVEIWFCENPKSADTKFEADILELVTPNTLLLLDRGFYHFNFWLQLTAQQVDFITRLRKGAAIHVEQVFTDSFALRDRLIRLGSGTKKTPFVTLRLVEIRSGKTWHSYLTSVLDPTVLPPYVVADLYRKRWRIEDAFNTVKRLLGLSYLWTGSLNGVQLQIWGTWLFYYAVLVDLGDAVADELSLPFDQISLEMIYRGLYHFYVAHQKGLASNPIKYFAAPENQDLGIVKRQRKLNRKLIVAPFPNKQRGTEEFFFQAPSKIRLTTASQP